MLAGNGSENRHRDRWLGGWGSWGLRLLLTKCGIERSKEPVGPSRRNEKSMSIPQGGIPTRVEPKPQVQGN